MNALKKYLAEFVGTFVLVLLACGTAAITGCKINDGTYIATALAFGLSIVAMAYSIGNVSGCHVNPAVSIGMLAAGRMSFKDFIGYVVFQFLGAIAGAAVLMSLEVILTCVFVLAVLGVTSRQKNSAVAGLVIGLTLTLVHLLGIPFTGTSVNPARSFGPALFVGGAALCHVWVFIVAPLAGGLLAALIHKLLGCGAPEE